MKDYKHILLILFSFFSAPLWSQDEININTYILDNKSLEPLPYAFVKIKNTNRATASNMDGSFQLDVTTVDTLIISFIGYKTKVLPAQIIKASDTIFLSQDRQLLNMVTLIGDDEYLYNVIADCRKTHDKKQSESKTYFALETYLNNKHVEVIEAYFNGFYSSYDLKNLQLKNGRIAITNNQENYFVTRETSRAILLLNTTNKPLYFPKSPLHLPKSKNKKVFELNLISKSYTDSNTIYRIDYYPKKDSSAFFSGSIWLDSNSNQLLKIEMTNSSASIHPFTPIFPEDSILNVEFKITRTFTNKEGIPQFVSTDFFYDLTYLNQDKRVFNVSTKAYLRAYDYNNRFHLPLFETGKRLSGDYRRILATPYNAFFWNNINEFELTNQKKKIDAFITKQRVFKGKPINNNQDPFKRGFFEFSFIPWNADRLIFLPSLPPGRDYKSFDGMLPSKRYNISTDIYVDFNILNGKKHLFTSAIYNAQNSFFYYPPDNKSNAFINIYFDLEEITRKKMALQLQGNLSYEEVKEAYTNSIEQLKKQQYKYLREVERGNDYNAMRLWNEYVKKELSIDNMKQFNVQENE